VREVFNSPRAHVEADWAVPCQRLSGWKSSFHDHPKAALWMYLVEVESPVRRSRLSDS
jgi:hypothetical protein